MLQDLEFPPAHIVDDWAIRSEKWISETRKLQPRRTIRQRCKAPLILCGHGASLRIENGALVIRDGFTHYPQEQAKHRFFPGDLALPPRIILLDGSGTLSFDVLSWLGEQSIALARIKWTGEIAVVASGTGYCADQKKVEWQKLTRAADAERLSFAADLIRRKLIASRETLKNHIAPSPAQENAIARAELGIKRLKQDALRDMNSIFAIEGECAAAYFSAWKSLAIRWTGTKQKPVPENWLTFSTRSSLLSGKAAKNRLTSHPVNAILNFVYTVRQTQLQIDAVAQGYDPTLGIMHNRHQGSPAYILDLIEPERPKVDAAVLAFIKSRSFSAADFVIRADGVCRLSPQLARAVAALVVS